MFDCSPGRCSSRPRHIARRRSRWQVTARRRTRGDLWFSTGGDAEPRVPGYRAPPRRGRRPGPRAHLMNPATRIVTLVGVRVTVLRLLSSEQPSAHGGGVTYLAEVSSSEAVAVPLETWRGELEDHPARQPYARPGGPPLTSPGLTRRSPHTDSFVLSRLRRSEPGICRACGASRSQRARRGSRWCLRSSRTKAR
jgi:hypothetical protein